MRVKSNQRKGLGQPAGNPKLMLRMINPNPNPKPGKESKEPRKPKRNAAKASEEAEGGNWWLKVREVM